MRRLSQDNGDNIALPAENSNPHQCADSQTADGHYKNVLCNNRSSGALKPHSYISTDENTFFIYAGGNCTGVAGKKASKNGI
jgi:hypothetical protein